jgi:hypothetical protein
MGKGHFVSVERLLYPLNMTLVWSTSADLIAAAKINVPNSAFSRTLVVQFGSC